MTMAGRISTWPVIARRASFTTIIVMGLSRTLRLWLAGHLTKTDADKPAWGLRWQITTVTGGWTFSRPISQMTRQRCIATTAMEFFPMSRITPAWDGIRNISGG